MNCSKRLLDIVFSGSSLVILSPVFLVIAISIKSFSKGPVFFLQERVGQSGSRFWMVKFRTMVPDAASRGPLITVAKDSRVTAIGSILRKYKLDELPQLWNVFKGEMSLVGPRPEVPVYVEHYTPTQMRVLSVRPGITDPASIAYRHEDFILAHKQDPGAYYQQYLLPQKLALSLRYIETRSLRLDLAILYQTLRSLFRRPSINPEC